MEPSHILFWNVRGLNSVARRDAVRVLVDSAKIDIVCLQETKMASFSRQIILSMLGSDFDNSFICLPSVGASGGVLIAWRSRLGDVQASRVDVHSASVQFSPSSGSAWWLTCVYGPQDTQEKI
jgi:exonuclease III